MKNLNYQSGFLDLKTGNFYRNSGGGHPENARNIVQSIPKLHEAYLKEKIYTDFEDFLIFRADFAKIGSCGEEGIIIKSMSMYKRNLKFFIKKYDLEDYEIIEWMH